MSTEIGENRDSVLEYLYDRDRETEGEAQIRGVDIQKATGLTPNQINDAVELLEYSGLVEPFKALGTAPFNFYTIRITARGKYEVQRKESLLRPPIHIPEPEPIDVERYLASIKAVKPPAPVGSPYGFTDADWELVAGRKANERVLYVVLGCKFNSSLYDTEELRKNIKTMFEEAVECYNEENVGEAISLEFVPLHAGYGEHLFNEIARDIISSDIAVFETSELAPNVFLEIGVALTWGSRVFLIKKEERPSPPSDISGQTYADYSDNARTFADPQHKEKLYRMVERGIRKKS